MEQVTVGAATIPRLGLGTWQNTGRTCTESVTAALECGYRHIDTAQAYNNEADVGAALADSNVPREEVFVTTKVWRSNFRAGDLQASVETSLEALGTDYVDLLLLHWPHPRVPVEESLSAMGDLQDDGVVRHVGVSNFTRTQLDTARELTDVSLVTNQVQYHPYVDQGRLHEYCLEHGVSLTAYSPLARGDVLDDPVLNRIGDRYGKSAAQVAIRWLLDKEQVLVIPKATSPNHIKANIDVFDFSLDDEERATIDSLRGSLWQRVKFRWPALMRRFPL